MTTANQVRQSFIDFFKSKSHQFVPSSPVVPKGDDTLLFTNAGMNQFKDIFLGLRKPQNTRAANSQKCIRAGGKHNDLEEVGRDTYHHTFFEMLGNWSFGDYFKAEAIEWAWELLVDKWGLDPGKFYATYFEGDESLGLGPDEEAKKLWLKFLPEQRVLPGSTKDNFWEMGDTGPCGPCSEMHYDGRTDQEIARTPGQNLVNKDHPQLIEVWNLVFIQYNRDANGLSPLPSKHVDTGMGFERIVRFLQNKTSNYDTDVFEPILSAISKISARQYNGKLEDRSDTAFRVIADHIRALTFAITDGATPSNEGRGYVLRRILRRAARFGRVLDLHEPFMYNLVDVITNSMGNAFPEIAQRSDFVKTVIESEEKSFNRTLDRGLEIFETAAKNAEKDSEKTIPGKDVFMLYDTYGFPVDLTQLMARERGLAVDIDGFEQLMQQQRQRARAAQKETSFLDGLAGLQLPSTDDSPKYDTDSCTATLLGYIDKTGCKTKGTIADTDSELALFFDKTCFYAESGGQVGDCGTVKTPGGKFCVEKTEKIADCVVHKGKLVEGELTVAQPATLTVDKQRQQSRKNHTATHLLQWALQQTLGESVHQQGSLVNPEYLRFDFTCPKALTDEQIKKVEQLVNEKIKQDLPVFSQTMPIDQAKKLGAMALFGEKYGDYVRVVAVGAATQKEIPNAFSREFCGGTHVTRTSQIAGFKIIKEESISAGVRRITALTGSALFEYLAQRADLVDELVKLLKAPPDQLTARVNKILEDNNKLTKQLKKAARHGGSDTVSQAAELLNNAEKIDQTSIVVGQLEPVPVDQARQAVDSVKKKASSAAIVFAMINDGKVILLAAVTDDLIKKGLKAGDIVKEIAPIVGGGGGGKPQLAQAGGKDPSKLNDALDRAKQLINEKIA